MLFPHKTIQNQPRAVDWLRRPAEKGHVGVTRSVPFHCGLWGDGLARASVWFPSRSFCYAGSRLCGRAGGGNPTREVRAPGGNSPVSFHSQSMPTPYCYDKFLLYWDFLNMGRKSLFKADILVKSIDLSTDVISEVKKKKVFCFDF